MGPDKELNPILGKPLVFDLVKKYCDFFPQEAAFVLTSFPNAFILKYLKSLTPKEAESIFSKFGHVKACQLVAQMADALFAKIFQGLEIPLGVPILAKMDPVFVKTRLGLLSPRRKEELSLALFPETGTAGALANPLVLTASLDESAGTVFEKFSKSEFAQFSDVCLVDKQNRFLGVVPKKELQRAPFFQPLREFCWLHPVTLDWEEQIEDSGILAKHGKPNFVAITDKKGHLFGVITKRNLFAALQKKKASRFREGLCRLKKEFDQIETFSKSVSRVPPLFLGLVGVLFFSFWLLMALNPSLLFWAILPAVWFSSSFVALQSFSAAKKESFFSAGETAFGVQILQGEVMIGYFLGLFAAPLIGALAGFSLNSFPRGLVCGLTMVVVYPFAAAAGVLVPKAIFQVRANFEKFAAPALVVLTSTCATLMFFALARAAGIL